MNSAKTYSIKVIGAFDIFDRENNSVRPSGRRDCALLAMLALTRNRRQTRTWLQEKLWGERGPAQAAASLRQSLTTLRSLLNGDGEVICADRTWVWLDPDSFDFDHVAPGARGEVLRGFDLREEGFNDWLREVRAEFAKREARGFLQEAPIQANRCWHIDAPVCTAGEESMSAICDLVCDSLLEALSVIGLHTAIDRRIESAAPQPRATDMVMRLRGVRLDGRFVLSLSVTDGVGFLKWQVRRELELAEWAAVRAVQVEIAQLLQD